VRSPISRPTSGLAQDGQNFIRDGTGVPCQTGANLSITLITFDVFGTVLGQAERGEARYGCPVIPIRDTIRSRTAPVVTVALIIVNVLVFLHEIALGRYV